MRRTRLHFPYALKVTWAQQRIRQWHTHWGGKCYVSYSGGKDSSVLLHIARSMYPGMKAVFCHSGVEYPEILTHVRSCENVTWIRPARSFQDVLTRFGYPVVSKSIARKVSDLTQGKNNAKTRALALTGGRYPKYRFPDKWKFLLNAPFPISNKCCDVMKRLPFWAYERQSGEHSMLGLRATESRQRQARYMQHQCNMYTARHPTSSPLAMWTDTDIARYIQEHGIPLPALYAMGWERTGCMYCLFSIQHDGEPNRIQRMRHTHPAQYAYAMQTLGYADVLSYLGIPYT